MFSILLLVTATCLFSLASAADNTNPMQLILNKILIESVERNRDIIKSAEIIGMNYKQLVETKFPESTMTETQDNKRLLSDEILEHYLYFKKLELKSNDEI